MSLKLLSCAKQVARNAQMIPKRTFFGKDWEMSDPVFHATGIEKKQLLAELAGNKDPFHLDGMKRGPGTKDKPNLIASCYDKRLVGCICDEESVIINYMWLHKGQPKRCGCGHWFKLVYEEPFFKNIRDPDFDDPRVLEYKK